MPWNDGVNQNKISKKWHERIVKKKMMIKFEDIVPRSNIKLGNAITKNP
jgi:hypothetical protein